MTFPQAMPHDPIEEIIPDVFMARGSVRMNALMTITRNMAIVRHGSELTLVDPIRLNDGEERRLDQLGSVKRILRLGPFHGVDDPYYIDRYGAELWAPGDSSAYPEPKPRVIAGGDTSLPFPDAELFCFQGLKQEENALLIRRDGGLLITCDSVQHYGDYRHNNLPARIMMPFIGFPKKTVVGPFWLKLMTPEGQSLESEFRRLISLDFEHLLSAHGSLLRGGAQASAKAAVDRAFARAS